MTTVLVLAAGAGTRFGAGPLPKQFATIGGQPLFVHALQAYQRAGLAGRLVLVAHPGLLTESRAALNDAGLTATILLTTGGRDRRASVRRGLDAARGRWSPGPDEAILLHNAASPNTDPLTIHRCVAALNRADVAQACVPELRTLLMTEDEHVADVLPRTRVVSTCDPTAYRLAALDRVLDSLGAKGDSTVDAALGLGLNIELVSSDYGNIKVTTRWDLEAVRAAMAANRPAAPQAAAG
jgi:2-C-methyl-D-erythritol 4-phosphate cytidylyltransferase